MILASKSRLEFSRGDVEGTAFWIEEVGSVACIFLQEDFAVGVADHYFAELGDSRVDFSIA